MGMPALIAICALGGLSVHIMTSSRLCFVGARNGHFPDFLSLVTANQLTPAPALVFLGALSLVYLTTSDVYRLIDYAAFVESMFILVTILGLLYLRYTRPDLPRLPAPICATFGGWDGPSHNCLWGTCVYGLHQMERQAHVVSTISVQSWIWLSEVVHGSQGGL